MSASGRARRAPSTRVARIESGSSNRGWWSVITRMSLPSDAGAAHVVPLGRVAVAVGAEEHDDLAGRDAPHRGERLLEGVGGVAEVDVDRGTVLARDEFGAAGQVGVDPPAVERVDEALPLVAALEDHDDREAGVGGHVASDDRHDGRERRGRRARRAGTRCPSALVEDLDDPVGGGRGIRDPPRWPACPTVTVGTSLRATTSAPGRRSRGTRPRGARGRRGTAGAWPRSTRACRRSRRGGRGSGS